MGAQTLAASQDILPRSFQDSMSWKGGHSVAPAIVPPSEPSEHELWFKAAVATSQGQKGIFPVSQWTHPGKEATTLLSGSKYVSYLQMTCYVSRIGFKGTQGIDGVRRQVGSTGLVTGGRWRWTMVHGAAQASLHDKDYSTVP